MKYKVVSFFTIGNGYDVEVKNLIGSLEKFGIDHDIRGLESRGSWQENTFHKPTYILEMLSVHKMPVVWLDADAVIQRKPDLFDDIETDVAFYFRTTGPAAKRFGGRELITATMFFSDTMLSKDLLGLWIDEIKAQENSGNCLIEQRSLQAVIPGWRASGGTITYLPQTYCRIFDAPEDDRVIVQNQASRRYDLSRC